jgi:hypothetical protein
MKRARSMPLGTLALLAALAFGARGRDKDQTHTTAPRAAEPPSLNAAQQQAVGIVVARPLPAAPPHRLTAYGQVLDTAALLAAAGRARSSAAAAQAAAAEARRLQDLYRSAASASLKELQAAQAAAAEARAQAQAAQAEFAQRWAPLAHLSPRARAELTAALRTGASLLLRADLPGRHSLGEAPRAAVVEVDGIERPARVLGALPPATAESQSAGWLLRLDHPPPGLGPGASLPVTLEGAAQNGLLVPADALLYGEQGAYVYKELQTANGQTRYAPAPVELLQPLGAGWLVGGLEADDRIVVHGAGVLWSLQGLSGVTAEEGEPD